MCTRGRDEGKPYRNTLPCRGKIFKYEGLSQSLCVDTIRQNENSPLFNLRNRSFMATYLNALMHFQRENIKVRKK